MAVFLSGFVFISIGIQLPLILRDLRGQSVTALIEEAALISLVLVRIAWEFPATYLPHLLFPRLRKRESVSWLAQRRHCFLVWDARRDLTRRRFCAALYAHRCVILTTLIFQALTLPLLIRQLRVTDTGEVDEKERAGRAEANRDALARIDELAHECGVEDDVANRLQDLERLAELQRCASG